MAGLDLQPLTQVEAAQVSAANQGGGGGRVGETAGQLLEKAAVRMQGGPVRAPGGLRAPGVAAGPQGLSFAAHERPGVTFGGVSAPGSSHRGVVST